MWVLALASEVFVLDICKEKIALRCNSQRDLVGKSEVNDNLEYISVDGRVILNDS
jgi:hypothetical protein